MTGSKRVPRRPLAVVGALVIAAAVGAALGTAGVVANAPGEPISFYGEATDVDGTPATEGTVIVAAVDGTEVDRITVDETGVYAGDSPTDEKLRTHTEAGDTVTFHVDDVNGPQATETHDIGESGVFELDLTFPTGTVSAESDDTQPSGGGSGGSTGAGESDTENRVTVELTLDGENTSAVDGADVLVSGSVAVAAAANSTIEIDLVSDDPAAGSGDDPNQMAAGPVASLENIEIDVAEDVEMALEVHQSTGPPGEDAQGFDPDDGTEPVGYVQIETNLTNEQVSSARFDFRMSRAALEEAGATPEDVTMYHFDEDTGKWEELPTEVVEEAADVIRFRAETDGFSQFVVGIKRAQFEIVEAAVDSREFTTGDTVEVEVTVANTGGTDGTFSATLRVGDELVDQSELSVAPDTTGVTVFEYVITEPGTYQLWVNDVAIDEIEVRSPADDEQQSIGDEDGGTTEESAGSDGLQGVGFVAVLVAILVAIAFGASIHVWRRR